jgi:hypothetical protein
MSEEAKKEINMMELLIKISNDVSSIKTDMTNFKEAQKLEKENTTKEIADVRNDYKRDLEDLESKVMSKIQNMQTVQNNLVGDVDTLKHAEEKKDAKRWKTTMAFIGTALGGLLLGKLPDIIGNLITLFTVKK